MVLVLLVLRLRSSIGSGSGRLSLVPTDQRFSAESAGRGMQLSQVFIYYFFFTATPSSLLQLLLLLRYYYYYYSEAAFTGGPCGAQGAGREYGNLHLLGQVFTTTNTTLLLLLEQHT
jgi:hypothetical protein